MRSTVGLEASAEDVTEVASVSLDFWGWKELLAGNENNWLCTLSVADT